MPSATQEHYDLTVENLSIKVFHFDLQNKHFNSQFPLLDVWKLEGRMRRKGARILEE
jgi:hypothetical protein